MNVEYKKKGGEKLKEEGLASHEEENVRSILKEIGIDRQDNRVTDSQHEN